MWMAVYNGKRQNVFLFPILTIKRGVSVYIIMQKLLSIKRLPVFNRGLIGLVFKQLIEGLRILKA